MYVDDCCIMKFLRIYAAITYGCFVAECGNADLSAPDSESTTFAVNDGERVCCRSGQYSSWTDSVNQGTCNACPPVAGEYL